MTTTSVRHATTLLALALSVLLGMPSAATALTSQPAKAASSGQVRDCYLYYDFPSIETTISCRVAKKVIKTAQQRNWDTGATITRTRGFRCVVKAQDLITCKDGADFIRYDSRE
jgi:hypothetical protein